MAKNNLEKNLLRSIKSLFSGNGNNPDQKPSPISEKPVEKRVSFNFEPGKNYKKTTEKDIVDNCSHCGAGYQGPLENTCSYCVSPRETYYIEEGATPVPPKEEIKEKLQETKLPTDNKFPQFGDQIVKLGDETKRARVVGSNITIGDYSVIKFIGASDLLSLGEESKIGNIIAPEIKVGDYFAGKKVITTALDAGDEFNVGVLFITQNGQVNIGDYSKIGKLILGPNSSVIFGDSCSVDSIVSTGNSSIISGDYFDNDDESTISMSDYYSSFNTHLYQEE